MDDLARVHEALDSVSGWLRVRNWGTSSLVCLAKGFHGIETSLVSVMEVLGHLSQTEIDSVFTMWTITSPPPPSSLPLSTLLAEAVATHFRRLSVVTFDVRSASTRAMQNAASALSQTSIALAFKGQETTDVLKLQAYRGFDFEKKDASAGLVNQMKAIDATAPSSVGVLSGDLLKASEDARDRAKRVLVAQRMGVPITSVVGDGAGAGAGAGADGKSSGSSGGTDGGVMGAQVHAGLTGFIVLCRVVYIMEVLPTVSRPDRAVSSLSVLGMGTPLADLVPSMMDMDVSTASLQDTWRFLTLATESWHTIPKTAHAAFRRLLHALCGRVGFFLVHPLLSSEVGSSVNDSVSLGHVNAVVVDGDTRFVPSITFVSKLAGVLTDMMRDVFGVSRIMSEISVADIGPVLASARMSLCKQTGSSLATEAPRSTAPALTASTRAAIRPALWRCGMDSVLAAVEKQSKAVVTGQLTTFGEDVYSGMVIPGGVETLIQDARLRIGGGMDTETARVFTEDGRVPPETALRILQISRTAYVTLTQHLVMMSPSVMYQIALAAYLPSLGPDGTDGGMDAVPVPVPSSTLSAVILAETDFKKRTREAAIATASAAITVVKPSDDGRGGDAALSWLGLDVRGGTKGGDGDDAAAAAAAVVVSPQTPAYIPSFRASTHTGRRMRMLRFALETYTTDQAAHLACRPDLCGFLFLRLLMSSLAASSSGVVLESFITPGPTILCQFVTGSGVWARSSLRRTMRPTIIPLSGGWFCVVMFDKRGRASRTAPLLSYEAALVWMSLVLVDPTGTWSSEPRLQRSVSEHMSDFGVKNHLFPTVDASDPEKRPRQQRPGGDHAPPCPPLLFDDSRIFRDVVSMIPGTSGAKMVSTSLVKSEVVLQQDGRGAGPSAVPRPFWRQAITDAGVVPDTMWTSLVPRRKRGSDAKRKRVPASTPTAEALVQLQAARAEFRSKKHVRSRMNGIGKKDMADLLFKSSTRAGGGDVMFPLHSEDEDEEEGVHYPW